MCVCEREREGEREREEKERKEREREGGETTESGVKSSSKFLLRNASCMCVIFSLTLFIGHVISHSLQLKKFKTFGSFDL